MALGDFQPPRMSGSALPESTETGRCLRPLEGVGSSEMLGLSAKALGAAKILTAAPYRVAARGPRTNSDPWAEPYAAGEQAGICLDVPI